MEEGPVGMCIHGGRWTRACIEGEGADGGWRGRAAGEAMHGQRTGEVVRARRTVGCAFLEEKSMCIPGGRWGRV
jgi:hypothetical protein